MPAFKLSDHFGFSVDVQAGPGALSTYFKNLPDWAGLAMNLKQFIDTAWDSASVVSTETLVSFNSPVNIGAQAVALKVDHGSNGRLSIFVPATENAPLFSPDVFGDNISVRLDERYVSASLQASVATTLGAPIDKLQFGFDGKSTVNLTYCQRFRLNPVTPPVLASIAQTLGNFSIPGDKDDVARMPEGSVAAVESSGTLKFTGDVNLLTFVNPLASVSMPVGSDLKVTAGGSIKVGAGYEFSGDYQVRVWRLPGSRFHFGFYRRRDQDFSMTARASAGFTTSLDQNSLFKTLLDSISTQPRVDQNELSAAGLPKETINAIQSALKSAIDRTLSLGMSMELHDSSEHDAMFLFEVDLNALSPQGETWLAGALQGNLGDIANRADPQSIGIRILKSLVGPVKTLKHTFKVNLLGIYNAVSISSLVRTGKTAWDATTGDFVMTDSATASKIGISAVNFGADTDKLRSVLAESLLITAAYRAGACVAGQPQVHSCHTFFATSARSHRDQMWRDLSIGDGLGFTAARDAIAKLPGHLAEFGRTTVFAETSYDDDVFAALYFRDGRQRTLDEYDRAGRKAITFLTRPEDPDGYRLGPATDDALWAQMRTIGNVQSGEFRQVLRRYPPEAVAVIGVDYINIVWWTKAMLDTGRKLGAIRQFLSVPTVSRTDPRFLKLKEDLADQLAKLAGRTQKDFGGPWGLLAMSIIAGQTGHRYLMFNPNISLMCETPVAVPALVG